MKQKFLAVLSIILISAILISSTVPAFAASPPAKVTVAGMPLDLTLPIIEKDGRNYYPFRQFVELLGAKVSWNQKTKTASATLAEYSIEFTIDSTKFKANGVEHDMKDAAPFISSDLTYVPIRYACEAFGFTVEWDQKTRTINIR